MTHTEDMETTYNAIPIAFAANHQFVPYFAACMQSLLEHSSAKYCYDLVLLHTDVTQEDQIQLLDMVVPYPNVSLRFYDVEPLIRSYNLRAKGHISVATYFRFLIQEILPEYDKVLYLYCDLIVNADVAELYQTDVDGYLLAAARDPEFLGNLHGADRKIQRYIFKKLDLEKPEHYFQAGVILFNEKEMRKANTLEQWLIFASEPYLYNDQDVLNIHCQGRVRFLDMDWNLLTDCDHTRISHVIAYAPQSVQEEYFAARHNPKIIHYAGYRKPWQKPTEDMADYFWSAIRSTPFYETALYRMSQFAAAEVIQEKHRQKSLYWRLRWAVRKMIKSGR